MGTLLVLVVVSCHMRWVDKLLKTRKTEMHFMQDILTYDKMSSKVELPLQNFDMILLVL